MAVFEQFDGNNVNTMRKAMELALEQIGKQFGMEFKVGRIKYNSTSFEANVTCAIGGLQEKEKADFERLCGYYGVPKEMYNVPFICNGSEYAIIGFNRKAPKYSFLLREVATGNRIKCTESFCKQAIVRYKLENGLA